MHKNMLVRLVLIALLCGSVILPGCGGGSKKKSAKSDGQPAEQITKQDEQLQEQTKTSGEEPQQPTAAEPKSAAAEPKKETPADIQQWQQTIQVVAAPTQGQARREETPTEQKPTVKLALKFSPGVAANYRVTMESVRSVLWEGPTGTKPANFVGGHTGNKAEMTFSQQIQSVGDNGNATAKITITALKYMARVKDNVTLDFNSTRQADKDSPLAKLIGQSYTIELTPSGEVANVGDLAGALAAIPGDSPAGKAAQMLLAPAVIKERHTIPALPTRDTNDLAAGDIWNSAKAFNFGMMGAKAYDRVYKLKEIQKTGDRQIVIAEMTAVPSADQAQQLYKEQTSGAFSKLFDNTESYTGQLKLDATSGQVSEYYEQLKCEWIAVDPEYGQNTGDNQNEKPNALRMAALRLYHIEKID